jgi:hypothetical protein
MKMLGEKKEQQWEKSNYDEKRDSTKIDLDEVPEDFDVF